VGYGAKQECGREGGNTRSRGHILGYTSPWLIRPLGVRCKLLGEKDAPY
jgi:hypothetical protein